jgi:hypothetical protein
MEDARTRLAPEKKPRKRRLQGFAVNAPIDGAQL